MHTTIEARDQRILSLLPSDQELKRLATGFQYAEGPVWDRDSKRLIFSDIPSSRMHTWSSATGIQIFRDPSNMANGNYLCRDGRLLTCEHASSRVVRHEHDGSLTVLASQIGGGELNSPNDIVERSDGLIYFTDPTYGRLPGAGVPRPTHLGFRGLYVLNPRTSELTCLVDDFDQPNGLCFSPDERFLFVNDSERYHIRRFRVSAAGSVSEGEVWARTLGTRQGSPDGMKVDVLSNVYCCAQGGIQVFSPSGEWLGTLNVPEEAGNLCFGGEGGTTIFITASSSLYTYEAAVSGARWALGTARGRAHIFGTDPIAFLASFSFSGH